MKKNIIFVALAFFTLPVLAGPPSVLGGKPISDSSAHYVGLGWPSMVYEWWHAGKPDWAIGGELVYGDWSGEFSDVDIGFALNVPFRWYIHQNGRTHVGFKLAPGALIAANDNPGDDTFIFGTRAEVGVPVTVEINDRINLITGGTIPFTVMFVEGGDPFVIVPIFPRIGVEFAASESITPSLLVELGPTIAFGDFGSEIEFGARAWLGAVFW